jgi:hypothetical protein
MSPVVERGMAMAKFKLAVQAALTGAADVYLKGRPTATGG